MFDHSFVYSFGVVFGSVLLEFIIKVDVFYLGDIVIHMFSIVIVVDV